MHVTSSIQVNLLWQLDRATSKEGLQIHNYQHHAATKKHPNVVYHFYERETVPCEENFGCCMSPIELPTSLSPSSGADLFEPPCSEESLLGGPCTSTALPEKVIPWLPSPESAQQLSDSDGFPWDIDKFIYESFPHKSRLTTQQEAIQDTLPTMNLKTIIPMTYSYMFVVARKMDSKKLNQRLMNQQCSAIFSYLSGNDFLEMCRRGLGHIPSETENHIISRAAVSIWKKLVQERLDAIISQQVTSNETTFFSKSDDRGDLSDIIRANVRHIGGACITKVCDYLVTRSIRNTFSQKSQLNWEMYTRQRSMLLTLRSPEADVMKSTADPASLEYVTFKQDATHGLAHMSDNVFNFFLHLYIKISNIHTTKAMHVLMDSLLNLTQTEISRNNDLLEIFLNLFKQEESDDETAEELEVHLLSEIFDRITKHFNQIHFAELLDNFKEKIPRRKTQALRPSLQSKAFSSSRSKWARKCAPCTLQRKIIHSQAHQKLIKQGQISIVVGCVKKNV